VLLEREDAVTLDTHVLGMTLVGMVALPLRRVLTAPSSVHLRGGCTVLLQRLHQQARRRLLGIRKKASSISKTTSPSPI
jgi:hypothetical protein